jgi:hypothetical protein
VLKVFARRSELNHQNVKTKLQKTVFLHIIVGARYVNRNLDIVLRYIGNCKFTLNNLFKDPKITPKSEEKCKFKLKKIKSSLSGCAKFWKKLLDKKLRLSTASVSKINTYQSACLSFLLKYKRGEREKKSFKCSSSAVDIINASICSWWYSPNFVSNFCCNLLPEWRLIKSTVAAKYLMQVSVVF